MSTADPYATTVVPRAAISFPCALPVPQGFAPGDPTTWPVVDGSLEYYQGALWFMPPSGEDQQDTVSDIVTELTLWRCAHPAFIVGTNEAGMKLGDEVRARVIDAGGERELTSEERTPPTELLPGLSPVVGSFFSQLDG